MQGSISLHSYEGGGAIGILGGRYSVYNRETKENLWNSTKEDCYNFMVYYLQENPKVTLILYELCDRAWVCSNTGKVRTDIFEYINNKEIKNE